MRLVQIGTTDISEHVSDKSYDMNSEEQYESWQDGNYVEHRVYIRKRIKGSFEVALYGKNGMDTQAFMDLWNANTSGNVTLLGVYVQNEDRFEAINAYCKIKGDVHKQLMNGNYLNKLKIEVVER